jgi:hypothetical protein
MTTNRTQFLVNTIQFTLVIATSVFVYLLSTKVEQIEQQNVKISQIPNKKQEEEQEGTMVRRIKILEDDVVELRKQMRQLQLQQQQNPSTNSKIISSSSTTTVGDSHSDTDYEKISSRYAKYECGTWTEKQVISWIEKALQGDTSQSHFFINIDGHALLDMLLDNEHSFSFGDKCFFLGVDREACAKLERASAQLLK